MNKAYKLTTYDRANSVNRAKQRQQSLMIACPDCKSPIGKACRTIHGYPAKPHWVRRELSQCNPPTPASPHASGKKYLYVGEDSIPAMMDTIHEQKQEGYELLGPIIPFVWEGQTHYGATMVRPDSP